MQRCTYFICLKVYFFRLVVTNDMILTSAAVLESQVSILLAIELIWNLCEVLFIDAAPGKSWTISSGINFPFVSVIYVQ